jgi:hypothetical protein
LQFPGFAVAAAGADETLGPARCKQVSDAGRFIAEAPLEVDQRAWKIGHLASPEATIVRDMFYHRPTPRSNILWPLTQRDKPSCHNMHNFTNYYTDCMFNVSLDVSSRDNLFTRIIRAENN